MRAQEIVNVFYRLIRFQSDFTSSIRTPFMRSMSSSADTSTAPDINRTLSFWFDGEEPTKRWFRGGSQMDNQIKDEFGDLVEQARASQLDSWRQRPAGTLALLILLDQFSRSIYRGTPASFSADHLAFEIATEAVAKGVEKQMPALQQIFFYMPLMHDERLITQVAQVTLFQGLHTHCSDQDAEVVKYNVYFAEKHRDVILKFGRFPSRNDILGRKSTPEEIEYLKDHPGGF